MFGGRFLDKMYVKLSRRLIHLAVHSEVNNIVSSCSHFLSKWDTFLRHPVYNNFIHLQPNITRCVTIPNSILMERASREFIDITLCFSGMLQDLTLMEWKEF